MKLIPQNEVEEKALQYSFSTENINDCIADIKIDSFKKGVEFAESKFEEIFKDIIIENQGLKLYKDNEPKRFKELALEFLNWYKFIDYEKDYLGCTTKDLYEQFIKKRNGSK